VIVVLGNRNAIQSLDNGETFHPLPKGKRATTVEIPDDMSLLDALRAIADLWPKHSHQSKPPAWVASDSPALATLVAENFGRIEIRDLQVDGTDDASSNVGGEE
jgi:hypothetical protein